VALLPRWRLAVRILLPCWRHAVALLHRWRLAVALLPRWRLAVRILLPRWRHAVAMLPRWRHAVALQRWRLAVRKLLYLRESLPLLLCCGRPKAWLRRRVRLSKRLLLLQWLGPASVPPSAPAHLSSVRLLLTAKHGHRAVVSGWSYSACGWPRSTPRPST